MQLEPLIFKKHEFKFVNSESQTAIKLEFLKIVNLTPQNG
jgi:hypothetical protein